MFHTPSFGDEVFDFTAENGIGAAESEATSPNPLYQQHLQIQSKRLRSMDESLDEYHSANDESFDTASVTTTLNKSSSPTPTTTHVGRKNFSHTDSNEPTKPLSAYALFFRDTVSAIKHQNPDCSFQELSRIVASMWEALDTVHKNVYYKKNELARSEYYKQMCIYKEKQQLISSEASENNLGQTKPADITRAPTPETHLTMSSVNHEQQEQQTQYEQSTNNGVSFNGTHTPTPTPTAADPSPAQIEMLADAGSVQKCMRENCNQRAIINPDWEDEYCSNECVVIHCRNVFNTWVQTNTETPRQ